MNKNIHFIFASFLVLTTYAQEVILTHKIAQKKSNSFLNTIIPILNERNNNTSILFIDEKQVYGYLFNENFNIIKKQTSKKRGSNYERVLGQTTSGNNVYKIFFSNNKFNKFSFINISFENSDSVYKEIELKLENEKYVTATTYNNKFYIITIVKDTSIFNIYSFENNNDGYIKTSIDFSTEKFIDIYENETNLYDLLKTYTGKFSIKTNIEKIKKDYHYSIDITSSNNKVYRIKDKLVFTLDENENITQLISINLDNFKKEIIRISQPFKEIDTKNKNTNSFIYEDHVFLISATNNKFIFQIQNYYTGDIIKTYSASENEVISFKNSPILEKETSRNKIIESENTKKILRKMVNGRIGISVHKFKNNFNITFGGKKIVRHDQLVEGIYLTYINGLYDEDFNHINGEIPVNITDKIYEFKEDKPTSNKTLFKFKDYYVLGSYFPWPHKQFRLRKFME